MELSLCESTAISRKDVGKSARENPERYCGWFWVHCSSKKFAGMVHVAIPYVSDCWRKATIKFDNYSVRNSVLIIFPILSFGIVTCTFFPTTSLEIAAIKFSLKLGSQILHFCRKVTEMGSILGHRIDYNGVGALRGQRHIPSKNLSKYPLVNYTTRKWEIQSSMFRTPVDCSFARLFIIKDSKHGSSYQG